MNELLETLQEVLILALIATVPFIGAYIRAYFKKKTELIQNEYYRNELNELIEKSVGAVQQTYVDLLKKEGAFTEEKQLEALRKVKEMVLKQLTDQSKEVLDRMYQDYLKFIEDSIENQVGVNKVKRLTAKA